MHNGGHGSALSKNKPAGAPMAVLRKGAWTPEEDLLLRRCIEKYGEGKWHQVPQRAGLTRCRKSCRLRWLNYLRPNLKRGDFAEDEIDLILRLHRLLGNKWSLIAGRIPGRTANDIKNYWNTRFNKTHAANSSVGTKAAGENDSGDSGSCKKVAESTHSKSYNKNTTMPNAFPAAARTQNKATTTTFTVIRPKARAVTASIRLAMTPATETKGAGGLAAHCSCPAPTGSGGDVHFPESSISPTPHTSDDEITVWWDSLLEGLVMGSDEQMLHSGSRGDPSAELLFRDEMLWGDEEE